MLRDDPFVVDTDTDNRSASVVQIDNGRHVNTIVICAVLCTVAALGAIIAWQKADNAETELRLVQYYLQDPSYRTQEELAQWARFARDGEGK